MINSAVPAPLLTAARLVGPDLAASDLLADYFLRVLPLFNDARAEKAEATRRAYRSDFDISRAWCAERRVSALPATPEAVAAFLAHEAERRVRPSTIKLAAILAADVVGYSKLDALHR